jgi:type I pantothenate kinase
LLKRDVGAQVGFQALLSRWPDHRLVSIVTTDGFLFPNQILEKHQLMNRKGFPESYDWQRLIAFLSDLKAGKRALQVPVYSHNSYDIIPDSFQMIDQPDIVILEGINVLQVAPVKNKKAARLFISDFLDFSIYVDAKTAVIKKWFMDHSFYFAKKPAISLRHFFTNSPHGAKPKQMRLPRRSGLKSTSAI